MNHGTLNLSSYWLSGLLPSPCRALPTIAAAVASATAITGAIAPATAKARTETPSESSSSSKAATKSGGHIPGPNLPVPRQGSGRIPYCRYNNIHGPIPTWDLLPWVLFRQNVALSSPPFKVCRPARGGAFFVLEAASQSDRPLS